MNMLRPKWLRMITMARWFPILSAFHADVKVLGCVCTQYRERERQRERERKGEKEREEREREREILKIDFPMLTHVGKPKKPPKPSILPLISPQPSVLAPNPPH